jgi:hypothetical protein
MRYPLLLVPSLVAVFGACPIHALAQADCSQREWRLLLEYDPQLMKAFDALDWKRYAMLQQELLARLSRRCLAALGQQQAQRRDSAADVQSSQSMAYDQPSDRYSVRETGACMVHGCVAH